MHSSIVQMRVGGNNTYILHCVHRRGGGIYVCVIPLDMVYLQENTEGIQASSVSLVTLGCAVRRGV